MKIKDLFKKYWATIRFSVIFLILLNSLVILLTYLKGMSFNLDYISFTGFSFIANILLFGYIGFILAHDKKTKKDCLWAGGTAGFIIGIVTSLIATILFIMFPEKVLEESFKLMQIKDSSIPFEFYKANFNWAFYVGQVMSIIKKTISGFFITWLSFEIFKKKK